MPRGARRQSESGIYHVICKGDGGRLLFEDDDDRRCCLDILRRKASEHGVSILAWCLMDNHVHLLVEDVLGGLSLLMHALCTSYARHFNRKTGHVGSVFQGRFTSIPITSDRQLLEAVRYIHENPAKAGLAPAASYPWSSYQEYVGTPSIVNTEAVLTLAGGRDGFVRLHGDGRPIRYFVRPARLVPDEEALAAACAVLEGADPVTVKGLARPERDAALRALRDAGITVKQIGRLTGVGRNTILRATRRR